MAKVSIYWDSQITDYIYDLRLQKVSHSSIKFWVYGYRFLFQVMKVPNRNIELKGNRAKIKIPIVLNQQEIKSLLDPKPQSKASGNFAPALFFGQDK